MVIETKSGSKVTFATNEVKQVSFAKGNVVVSGEDFQTISEKLTLLSQRIDSLANVTAKKSAPFVRISPITKEWEISNDGGQTWASTGVVAEGKQGPMGQKGEDGLSPITEVQFVVEGENSFLKLVLVNGSIVTVPVISFLLN